MIVDREYCMSSYLALRYIERDDCEFADGLRNRRPVLPASSTLVEVATAADVDEAIADVFKRYRDKRLGLLLSGGMDSGILASYMPGADAYTFRFLGGDFQGEELARAESMAKRNGMTLHYVDIDWDGMVEHVYAAMEAKGAPLHSIEPQILQAALQAKADGIEEMVIGDAADYVFGGMDQLLSREWTVEDFERRYTSVDPAAVLREPFDMGYIYERYRRGDGDIDLMGFFNKVVTEESYGSYQNAFAAAGLAFVDPYEHLCLSEPLDLRRIRSGESKYLIRELFSVRYPGLPVPEKLPMPRPVDAYFAGWDGPTRPEFRDDIAMSSLTGNQKWQLWCLEQFLNMIDRDELSE